MSNFKYDLTDAAIGRVEKRIAQGLLDENPTCHIDAHQRLRAALEPEHFHPKANAPQKIIAHWIREERMGWLCSQYFLETDRERVDLQEAGRNLMNGIRAFGRHRL